MIATICRRLRDEFAIGVITNGIYSDEDARFPDSEGVTPVDPGPVAPHHHAHDNNHGHSH